MRLLARGVSWHCAGFSTCLRIGTPEPCERLSIRSVLPRKLSGVLQTQPRSVALSLVAVTRWTPQQALDDFLVASSRGGR